MSTYIHRYFHIYIHKYPYWKISQIQEMRTQDQLWCSGGGNPHCSLTKNSSALRLCMPVMLGKSSHHEKIGSSWPLLILSKKYPPLPLPISFKNVVRPPKRKLFLFWIASLNRVLLGTRYFMNSKRVWWSWTYHASHRGTRLPYCVLFSKLSPLWRMFFEGERKGAGFLLLLKNSKMVVLTHFFMVVTLTQHAWHAKSSSAATFCWGAVRVFAATTPSLILCPHPLPSTNSRQLILFGKHVWLMNPGTQRLSNG